MPATPLSLFLRDRLLRCQATRRDCRRCACHSYGALAYPSQGITQERRQLLGQSKAARLRIGTCRPALSAFSPGECCMVNVWLKGWCVHTEKGTLGVYMYRCGEYLSDTFSAYLRSGMRGWRENDFVSVSLWLWKSNELQTWQVTLSSSSASRKHTNRQAATRRNLKFGHPLFIFACHTFRHWYNMLFILAY